MPKITLNCLNCKKEIYYYPSAVKKGRKFCSKICYSSYPKDTSNIDVEAIKQRNLEYYKNTPKDVLQKRWDKIGEARKVRLTEEELKRLEEVLSLGYVKDKNVLMEVAEIEGKSYKAYLNKIKDDPEWIKQFNPYPYQLTHKIQKLKPYQFRELLKDLTNHSYVEIKQKWGIGNKTSKALKDFYKITKSFIFKGKETFPEKVIRGLLEEYNMTFCREKYVNNGRYRVDFMIDNKVIEVQGDFWHANPEIYDINGKLSYIQVKNIENDKNKLEWLIKNGFKVLYLWENDIKNNIEKVKTTLYNFIYG